MKRTSRMGWALLLLAVAVTGAQSEDTTFLMGAVGTSIWGVTGTCY